MLRLRMVKRSVNASPTMWAPSGGCRRTSTRRDRIIDQTQATASSSSSA